MKTEMQTASPTAKKNIGIYLGSTPEGGGTYQYNLSIIKALETFDRSKYRMVAFFRHEAWQTNLPDEFDQIFVKEIGYRKIMGGIYRRIDRSKEGLRRFSCLFNPMVSTINKGTCDIVIFPSQDALSYQCRKKSLCAIHDLMHRYEPQFREYKFGEYAIRERHYSNICKYAAGILADSNLGKEQIVASYAALPEKVFALPFIAPYYLLDAKPVDIRGKFNLPERYVFYPAQFWEHKNHLRLLEALKILRDKGVDVHLVLTGAPGYNYGKISEKIEQFDLGKHVRVLGYISNDDMYSLYRNAVALVFVSLIGPTNIPPLEAMAAGCPAIVSNIYAMPDQVGDAGLMVDPLNPADIAHKISIVWKNETLRQSMIEKGFKQIRKWGNEQFNSRLKDIVDKILSRDSLLQEDGH